MRMQKLVRSGYIEKRGINLKEKNDIIYSLTEKGFLIIKQSLDLEREKSKFKSDSIHHDVGLTELRLMLENFEMIKEYYSENYLQNCFLAHETQALMPYRKINADAALKLSVDKESFFVSFEYERGIKNQDRYASKLMDYYLVKSITAVFYLCSNERIKRMIIQTDKEVNQKYGPKVFALSLSELQEPVSEMSFSNSQNGIFTIK
jgi:hypothetical protein